MAISIELVDLGEHHLRDFTTAERVFQVLAPGLVSDFPPLRSVDTVAGNLPRQMTAFVGRASEIRSLVDMPRTYSGTKCTAVRLTVLRSRATRPEDGAGGIRTPGPA